MVISPKPCFVFPICLFFFCISLKTHKCIESNSISQGQSLTGNQTIISPDGEFELGFFTPGMSHNQYIGIWFRKVPKQTVVWVANREAPLPNTSYTLEITQDGNLVLTDQSKVPIWSTNSTSTTSNSTVLELLDSGNLILRDGSNSITWQSFDHPTDTWLPGAWIGLNKVTNKTVFLTSWKSSEDPSPGSYSLEIDKNGASRYYLLWKRSVPYWDTGIWNRRDFSFVPELGGESSIQSSFVNNESLHSFTYTIRNSSVIFRTFLESTGQVKTFLWLEPEWNLVFTKPAELCDVYSLCGPFDYCYQSTTRPCRCLPGFEQQSSKERNLSDFSGGCARKTPLQCTKNNSAFGKKDKFLMIPHMGLPENPQSKVVQSVGDCELACLNNCSCAAYTYRNGCAIFSGDLLNLRQRSNGDTEGKVLYLRLAASELPDSKHKKKYIIVIVGGASGATSLLIIVLVVIWRCQRRRLVITSKLLRGPSFPFRYQDLRAVTKNFSEKLGGGGFGSVYKGALRDSTLIAVKKLEGHGQGEKQFRSEVGTIGKIQHVNLVHLLGFCSEGDKRLLVYEYLPNGSLDYHLFRTMSEVLDWKTRYQIALGTARALAYLHEKCRECIIHCDIKPENILLDVGFYPKVSDFGLAKLVGRDFSRVLTTMRGTRGYLAPEWLSGMAITSKADVYSYGMMLFEIISGRRNSEQPADGIVEFFPSWAAKKIVEDEVLSLLDYRLDGVADMRELTRTCRVACWCVQDRENDRPSMGLVVQILEGVFEVNMPPIPRLLQIAAENQSDTVMYWESSSGRSSNAQKDGSETLHKSTLSSADSN